MGFFSKLFSKDDKEQKKHEPPKEERIFFDDDFTRFYYFANPNTNEFGYEGELKPLNPQNDYDALVVYLEADTPETTEATKCYAMFKETMADMERFDYDMKRLTAAYCIKKPDYFNGKSTEQQLVDSMNICWMGFFRNGNIEVSIDSHGEHGLYMDNAHLILKADGSKQIEIEGFYGEKQTDTL